MKVLRDSSEIWKKVLFFYSFENICKALCRRGGNTTEFYESPLFQRLAGDDSVGCSSAEGEGGGRE